MSTEPDAPPSDDDATRQEQAKDATSDDDDAHVQAYRVRQELREEINRAIMALPRCAPEYPTLYIHVRDKNPEIAHDPRLGQLDFIDRVLVLQCAGRELNIKPAEYHSVGSHFMTLLAVTDRTRSEQWLRVTRILRAAFYEAQNLDSDFLKEADAAARNVLKQHNETELFSSRSAAFERLRTTVVSLLEMNETTANIAMLLSIFVSSDPAYHEIARHIPDLNRPTISAQLMLDKLQVARDKPRQDNFTEQAEYMIRAWLRAMGCPEEIVRGAFDAERARDERELGLR